MPSLLVAALQYDSVMNHHENHLDNEKGKVGHNLPRVVWFKQDRVDHWTLVQLVVASISQMQVELICIAVQPFNVKNIDFDVQVPDLQLIEEWLDF